MMSSMGCISLVFYPQCALPHAVLMSICGFMKLMLLVHVCRWWGFFVVGLFYLQACADMDWNHYSVCCGCVGLLMLART